MVVAAHLLADGGLVHDQFFNSVGEKTALPVHAVPALREATAQLQLTLRPRLCQALVAYVAHQTIIIIPCTVPIRTRAALLASALIQSHHHPQAIPLA